MMGKFGVGERNDRGDRLLEFADSRGFKIMNTFFKKKASRKWTWRSPNGTTKNEIDFILTNKPTIVKDVSVLNRFNTGSDHRLVRAKLHINFRLERCKLVKKKRAQMNMDKLQQNKEEFQIKLKNQFQILQDEVNQEDINEFVTTSHKQSKTVLWRLQERERLRKLTRSRRIQ